MQLLVIFIIMDKIIHVLLVWINDLIEIGRMLRSPLILIMI